MSQNNSTHLEKKEEIIIGIDLGTTYSCAAIYRKKKKDVDVIAETQSGIRSQPSIVCFKNNNECLIGISAKDNIVTANVYVFEYYTTDTPKELSSVEELRLAIRSSNALGAINIVKGSLNGKATHKQLQFIINNGGKFFKYQILNSKKLDY